MARHPMVFGSTLSVLACTAMLLALVMTAPTVAQATCGGFGAGGFNFGGNFQGGFQGGFNNFGGGQFQGGFQGFQFGQGFNNFGGGSFQGGGASTTSAATSRADFKDSSSVGTSRAAASISVSADFRAASTTSATAA